MASPRKSTGRTETTLATIAHPALGTFDVGLRHTQPDGEPIHRVLLVGGTGQPPERWSDTEDALQRAGCEVVATAGRGVRPTQAPPLPWSVDDLVTDTIAVLDHLGWTQPVTLVGYSLGGFAVEQLARRHPNRVAHAILLAGHHETSALAKAGYRTHRALIHDREGADAFYRFLSLVTTLYAEALAQNHALTQTWWELLDLHSLTWTEPHAAEGQIEAATDWIIGVVPRPALAPGRVRFTLICFDDDLLMPAGAPARVAAVELGGCPVVELPGGHGGMLTNPLDTAEAVTRAVLGER